jgi:hypothetical protein
MLFSPSSPQKKMKTARAAGGDWMCCSVTNQLTCSLPHCPNHRQGPKKEARKKEETEAV